MSATPVPTGSDADAGEAAALQVLIARLSGIAAEMGAVLQRSAFSPNIKERADCSAAVFDAQGRLLAQAEHIPVHLGSMPASVAAVIDALGDRLEPGDQAIVNDPFAGGTHLNDITLVAPCFVGEPGATELIGWVANRAHHADVGGSAPGSMPADAFDIHAEGVRLPPMLLTDEIRTVLLANSRTPRERSGDLAAQVGANAVGVQRLRELPGAGFDHVLAHGERRCRAVLDRLVATHGGHRRASAFDVMDSTGPRESQQQPALIHCEVSLSGEGGGGGAGITFDFTGSDPQSAGNTNAVLAVTLSAVSFVLRAVLDPSLPANAGVMAPVRVVAESGSIVAATAPAAVGAGNVELSQRIVDVCQRALADLVPERVGAAGQGTMNNVLIGGDGRRGGPWVYYETIGGGQGGRPPVPDLRTYTSADPKVGPGVAGQSGIHTNMTNTDQVDYRSGEPRPGQSGIHTAMTNTDQVDYRSAEPRPGQSGIHTAMTNTDQVDYRSAEPRPGQSGIHTAMTNSRNTPAEVLERTYPMRVLRYRIRKGSGGDGWARGGDGIERDLQMLEDVTVSLITERRVSQPWGLAGGEPGAVGENWLLPGGDESRAERLPDKCTLRLAAGDVLRMLTPGGGGWGRAADE